MVRLFRIIDSSDPECWTCTGTHSDSWRALSVRYMMAPSRTRSDLVSRRLLNCDLIGGKPSKLTQLLTHFQVLCHINCLLSYLYSNMQRTQNPHNLEVF